jgi:hypothetical protein
MTMIALLVGYAVAIAIVFSLLGVYRSIDHTAKHNVRQRTSNLANCYRQTTRNWALTSKLCQWSEKWQKPINWQDSWSLHCWVISRLPPLERLFSRLFGRREAAKT